MTSRVRWEIKSFLCATLNEKSELHRTDYTQKTERGSASGVMKKVTR
jgi:hypothetical protein